MIVVVAAILFILVGVPLPLCLLSIPLVATGILLVVIAGWIHQLRADQHDLQQLYHHHYQDHHQACLLVAEVWDSPVESGVQFVTESQLSKLTDQGFLGQGRGRLCGTVAVRVKEDKDMGEPPGTVGK